MFQTRRRQSLTRAALVLAELVYHSAVRSVRQTHRNALVGLVLNIAQTVTFVLVFYLIFSVIGARGAALRGDFMLYLMSGIFLYLTHTKAMGAVVKSEGPTSPIMQHAPLNTAITISAAALGALYIQMLSLLVVLFFYHVLVTPVVIDDPVGAMGMVVLAWFTGVAVGLVFLALKPWAPEIVEIGASIYARVNLIASGKMFVANTLPGSVLVWFDWNPLFHIIDQCRGFVFINYNPHFSSISYAVWVGVALAVVGLMGESYTRRHASRSWGAAR